MSLRSGKLPSLGSEDEFFDHKGLLKDYVRYYHEDRTHLGLEKDTPGGRVAASAPGSVHKIISLPRLGGLHHRYAVAA
jgi:hypothetical protein